MCRINDQNAMNEVIFKNYFLYIFRPRELQRNLLLEAINELLPQKTTSLRTSPRIFFRFILGFEIRTKIEVIKTSCRHKFHEVNPNF